MSDEVTRLREALAEAIEDMEDMIVYVPQYFREKWRHDRAISKAKRALGNEPA